MQAGAIGKVVQTMNIAPHQMNSVSRPAWFFDKGRYGGILTDIGSHQADQFLFYTNSTKARVVPRRPETSRTRNIRSSKTSAT